MHSFISLSLLFAFISMAIGDHIPRHAHARFSPRSVRNDTTDLVRRQGPARFTWYKPGLGACGGHNDENDFIVALNRPEWNGGSHCGDAITITYKGKTAHALIVDLCMGCPPRSLDFSPSLFRFFAPTSEGEIHGDWTFGRAENRHAPHRNSDDAASESHHRHQASHSTPPAPSAHRAHVVMSSSSSSSSAHAPLSHAASSASGTTAESGGPTVTPEVASATDAGPGRSPASLNALMAQLASVIWEGSRLSGQ